MITRFAVINDERKVLLGIDKGDMFEPGQVYEVNKILDEIIIRKVGPYALPDNGPTFPNANSDVNSQVHGALHLLTKKEFEKISQNF